MNTLPMGLTETQVGKFRALLGAPSVLSTENAEHYNEMWGQLVACLMPGDFMELFLIWQVQDATWMIMRYSRHRTIAVERGYRESLEFQVKRRQMQKARREAIAQEIAEKAGRPVSELQRLIDLDLTVESAPREALEIVEREPSEIDHNRALETGIKFQTQLDQLINSANRRRETALKQLEFYRDGLGPYLRRVSDEIIDVATLQTEELSKTIEVPLNCSTGARKFRSDNVPPEEHGFLQRWDSRRQCLREPYAARRGGERMSSEREIAANRRNARRSRGPRTAAGKSVASRNALRHGLAALVHRHPVPSVALEEFAQALCNGDNDPALMAQARRIANNEMVLRAINAQQIAVVERCREPTAIALAKGDNSLALARARSRQGREAEAVLKALVANLIEKYKDELPPPIPPFDSSLVPVHLEEFLQEKETDAASTLIDEAHAHVGLRRKAAWERDEAAALEEAALDLVRLDRYERRAWSQQKRAILEFMNIKLMKALPTAASAFVTE
jgi:hypothetical protein